jgi:DNA invertase Pin-like site-specific DNA recombinase
MAIYGYCRVSTDGQSLAAQHSQLNAVGCDKVYAEKISGAVTNRPELTKALAELQDGDVFLVCRLDRLARSTRDLLNILDTISKAGAGFRSLADTWADTTTAHGRLMLTVLGGISEFERSLIMSHSATKYANAVVMVRRWLRLQPSLQCIQLRSRVAVSKLPHRYEA